MSDKKQFIPDFGFCSGTSKEAFAKALARDFETRKSEMEAFETKHPDSPVKVIGHVMFIDEPGSMDQETLEDAMDMLATGVIRPTRRQCDAIGQDFHGGLEGETKTLKPPRFKTR
jgi:hypothetical protein